MTISISNIKYPLTALMASCAIGCASARIPVKINEKNVKDTFEYVDNKQIKNPVDKYTQEDLPKIFRETVNPSSWTNDPEILKNAPDPTFTIKGENKTAKGVVDITNCRFYVYDDNGKAIESFRVATGAISTPTSPGIRRVLAKLVYPYETSPPSTKRYRFPYDYGPKIAYLKVVDPITGEMHDNGGYCHGTKHESAVLRKNRHLTHGCVRFHNRDALYVINDVLKIGDYLKYVK